jgi:hypothetical protein
LSRKSISDIKRLQKELSQNQEKYQWRSYVTNTGRSNENKEHSDSSSSEIEGGRHRGGPTDAEELLSCGYKVIPDVIEDEHGRIELLFKVREPSLPKTCITLYDSGYPRTHLIY